MRPLTIARSAVPGAAAALAMALAAVGVAPGDAQAQASDTEAAKVFDGRPEDARRFVKDYLANNLRRIGRRRRRCCRRVRFGRAHPLSRGRLTEGQLLLPPR